MKVLLVDGNMMTSSKIASLLRTSGYEVLTLKDGDLSDVKVALVNLEALGGEKALESIKKEHPHIKVIAYCGHKNTDLKARARDLGADLVVPNSRIVVEAPDLVRSLL
ncbi:MAG: response regulator [Aquificota bacterium]|nr:response regulator [Aquificota bacterium]